MATLRQKLGIAVAAVAATMLLVGSALAGNPNAPGTGNSNSPAKGGTPPGQAKKGTPAQGNGSASKGKALGKAKNVTKSHPAHPATPSHPSSGQGQSASHKPAFAATKGKGHEKAAGHKVIICHRTGSTTNPYVQINISINAWMN